MSSSEDEAAEAVAETPMDEEPKTFAELGVTEALVEACGELGWAAPTPIQREAIPVALQGRDLIGLAETGSGKTAAFALPILQSLLEKPRRMAALVLTPTRELAFQIGEQFTALGAGIGLKAAVVVGGIDMVTQSVALAKRPHVIIATPGRLVDHLENTKGFHLSGVSFLVMDEADRILNMDFEAEVDKILRVLPKEGRRTFLFSATMTKKVAKLQRASLVEPVKVEVSSKYQTVEKLSQHYLFIPAKHKVALMLRSLGFDAVPLNGQMSQAKRLGALNKFKAKSRSLLLATDVASRGLDIPHVDVVLNYDIPSQSKDYIHRVGRTARAGRSGLAITLVTQYDVELYQRIEHLIGKKLPLYPVEEDHVQLLMERTDEAKAAAKAQLKEMEFRKKGKGKGRGGGGGGEAEDAEGGAGLRRRLKGPAKGPRKAPKRK